MLSDPAHIARTLAAGFDPPVVQIAWSAEAWSAPCAADASGRPLLLTASGQPLDRALSSGNGLDTAVSATFADSAPVPGAPGYGQAWIGGWATPLSDAEARQAAVAFSEVNPITELLDVGDGFRLWRVEVAEVRLANGPDLIDVPVAEYAAASPDVWRDIEEALLTDLYDHHLDTLDRITGHVRSRFPDIRWASPVRMDASGLTVTARRAHAEHDELLVIRLRAGHDDLPAALHELTCCRCLDVAAVELIGAQPRTPK